MADYVSQAACRGLRPQTVATRHRHARPHLVSRLLAERRVARFIVAPPGMGKSVLAAEYAALVLDFDGVMWFNAQSPCFIRELDDGDFAGRVLNSGFTVRLVVFDDVPALSDERADALSSTIDALLDADVEVIAALLPTADAYGGRQHDRVVIRGHDLLLNDEEMAAVAGNIYALGTAIRICDRIPCVAWGDALQVQRMMKRAIGSEPDVRTAMLAMLMLAMGTGSIDEIEELMPVGGEALDAVTERFLFCGYDEAARTFDTHRMDAYEAERMFHARLLQDCRPWATLDECVSDVADRLLRRGNGDRACALIRAATVRTRAEWLVCNELALADGMWFAEASAVRATCTMDHVGLTLALTAGEAWRYAIAGRPNDAAAMARRVMAGNAKPRAMVEAAVLIAAYGTSDDRQRAMKILTSLAGHIPSVCGDIVGSADWDAAFWKPLASTWTALEQDFEQAMACWDAWREYGADRQALLFAALRLVEAVISWEADEASAMTASPKLASWLMHEADDSDPVLGQGASGYFALRALQAVAALHGRFPDIVPASANAGGNALLSRLNDACELFRQHVRSRSESVSADTRAARPSVAERSLPLHVRLFGGVNATIGETMIDFDSCRRHKVRTLLTLLVLESGREMMRDAIVEDLWPDSSLDCARKNLYTIWSQLRRLLGTEDGTCPYLIRYRTSYRIDGTLVTSDVDRMGEICRHFLSAPLDAVSWGGLLGEFERCASGELCPGEEQSERIRIARRELRNKAVEALLAGSRRLMRDNEADLALEFAKAAYARDHSREDVAAALMAAQIALGQRASALETYFSCRRYLADELGIDPAQEIVSLYRSIIEEEAVLVV